MKVIVLFLSLSLVSAQKVDINWNEVLRVSKTLATLQVVVNPLLERKSKVHNQVFKGLESLNASHVRYVPWLPYPKLAVAELEPPTAQNTSWNFSLIDPMLEDFMRAQNGREVIINFSTMPAWLFKTPKKVPYPADPDQVDWNYTQGTELVDPTMKELADYYERLVSWYVKGGFIDENGKKHTSGHSFKFDYWEVFNEIESEHKTTPQQYTERYDAVVSAVRKASPNTKFVGLALAYADGGRNTFLPYFLNHSNHKPDIPLDAISYHFYASSDAKDSIDVMQTKFFTGADGFLNTVKSIEIIRKSLSPNTETMINELGTFHEGTSDIPKEYWNLSGAVYAYIFSVLSEIGIEFAGESQLVGYPTQFPSVSMVDWNTGELNARAMVLKLLIENFGPGDKIVNTTTTGSDHIHGLAFITKTGTKRLLLINKHNVKDRVVLQEVAKKWSYIDVETGNQIKTEVLNKNSVELGAFAVTAIDF